MKGCGCAVIVSTCSLLLRGISAAIRQGNHLSDCSDSPSHLFALMARVVVAVFHEEERSNDRSRIQSQDQTGAFGSQGDCVPSAVQRETSPTEYGKPTPPVCGGSTFAGSGMKAGSDFATAPRSERVQASIATAHWVA